MKAADLLLLAAAASAVWLIATRTTAGAGITAGLAPLTAPPNPDPLERGIRAWYRPQVYAAPPQSPRNPVAGNPDYADLWI